VRVQIDAGHETHVGDQTGSPAKMPGSEEVGCRCKDLEFIAQRRRALDLFGSGAVLPMLLTVPLSVFLLKRADARVVLAIGLSAFAAAGLLERR
jgi:hypothetical protein